MGREFGRASVIIMQLNARCPQNCMSFRLTVQAESTIVLPGNAATTLR